MAQTTDLLNNTPWQDPNLKAAITSLQKETPEVTYYTTGSVATNPTTTATSLFAYEIDNHPVDRPYELRIEALVKVTSNLSGDQEFTATIYDVVDDATPFSFGAVDIPDALNTAVLLKYDYTLRTSNSSATQNVQFGEVTLYSLDGGAITSVVIPSPKVESAEDAIRSLQFRITAETGTATTSVQLISAKVTLDRRVWN